MDRAREIPDAVDTGRAEKLPAQLRLPLRQIVGFAHRMRRMRSQVREGWVVLVLQASW